MQVASGWFAEGMFFFAQPELIVKTNSALVLRHSPLKIDRQTNSAPCDNRAGNVAAAQSVRNS
jgi:hypothetical protein